MRLNKTEREEFRRRVKNLIPQMEKLEIVNQFQKVVYPRRTIFNTINRMQHGGKKESGRSTSWSPVIKNQLKRLTYIVRGSQFVH